LRSRRSRHIPSAPTRRSSDLLEQEDAVHHPVVDAQIVGRVAVQSQPVDIVREDALTGVVAGEGLSLDTPLSELEPFVGVVVPVEDRKSTRLNSSHVSISYAVF